MDRNNEKLKINQKNYSGKENISDYSLISFNVTTPKIKKDNFNINDFSTPEDSNMSLCITDKTNLEQTIERYLMSLNQEFISFGLPAIFLSGSNETDIRTIVSNSWKIIQMLRQNNKTRYSLELRQMKSESEFKHMQQLMENLRNEVTSKDKEMNQQRFNCSILETKNNEISRALKTEKDEVKKLNSIMLHRDAQFKNDLRKKELELNKLKERLTQKVAIIKSAIDLTVPANKKNHSQFGADRDLLISYEEKEKALKIENISLRKIIASIFKTVNFQIQMCEQTVEKEMNVKNMTHDSNVTNINSTLNLANSSCHNRLNENVINFELKNNIEDILKMPVEMIFNEIENKFGDCIEKFMGPKNTRLSYSKPLDMIHFEQEDEKSCNDFDQLQSDLEYFRSLCEQQDKLMQNLLENETADISFLKDSDHLDKTLISIAEPNNHMAIIKKAQQKNQGKAELEKLIQDFYDITPFRGQIKSPQRRTSSTLSLQITPNIKKRGIELNRSTPSILNISCQIPSTFDLYKTLNYINSPAFISYTLTKKKKVPTATLR